MAFVTPLLVGAAVGAVGAWIYVRQLQSQMPEAEAATAEQSVVESDLAPRATVQADESTIAVDS